MYSLCVLIVCINLWVIPSLEAALISSRRPVEINLRRVKTAGVNATASVDTSAEVRTSPLLFQEYLGLKPGKPFTMDLQKWRDLQNCGLFSNLTAKTYSSRKGEVTMVVTGNELPAIQFSPEVTVGASLNRPEVSGAIVYRDNNLGGLGERLEVVLSTGKEGLDGGDMKMSDTPRLFRCKWIDGIVGRPSSITAMFEQENTKEDLSHFVQDAKSHRGATIIRTVQVKVQDTRPIASFFTHHTPIAATQKRVDDEVAHANAKYELQPYNIEVFHEDKARNPHSSSSSSSSKMLTLTSSPPSLLPPIASTFLSGAKAKWTLFSSTLPTLSLSADVGLTRRSGKAREKYQQVRLDVSTQTKALFDIVPGANSTRKDPLSILYKLKWIASKSWGAGCVPHFHHTSFEDPSYLRGFHQKDMSPYMPSFFVTKGDIFVEGLPRVGGGIPGIFVDLANFHGFSVKEPSVSKVGSQAAVGISFRVKGFRCELGWPCTSASSRPRFYLGIDD